MPVDTLRPTTDQKVGGSNPSERASQPQPHNPSFTGLEAGQEAPLAVS